MDTLRTAFLAPAFLLFVCLLACGGGGGGGDPADPADPGAGDPPLPPDLPPRVAIPLSSINASADGGTSTHSVNPGAFVDPEGDPLTVSADRPDGSPLPSWVLFDATTMRLTLEKDDAPIGTTTIRIRAADPAGGTAQFLTALNLSGGPLPTGRTLISRPDGPGQSNGDSNRPVVSGLGYYVAFQTESDNLHPAQSDAMLDVLVRHVWEGTVEQANSNAAGVDGSRGSWDPVISFDGRRVAFVDATPWFGSLLDDDYDIFLKDLDTAALTHISSVRGGDPDGHSSDPSLALDGALVAFHSLSTLLVPEDTNGEEDVFIRDVAAGTTTRESRTSAAPQVAGESKSPALSADGRFVVFETRATEFPGLAESTRLQIVLRDRDTGAIEVISRNAAGDAADESCTDPSVSADGRFVAFATRATNLDPSDSDAVQDIYVRDRWTDEVRRVTHDGEGSALPGSLGFGTSGPSLSADGRFLAMATPGTPAPQDENFSDDIYVLDLYNTRYHLMTQRTVGGVTPSSARYPDLSASARAVVCSVRSDDMSASDTNGLEDVWWIPTGRRGGTLRDDDLQGTSEDDWLRGLDGHDKLSGLDGNDFIEPGPGFDELRGGLGADTYIWWSTDEGLDHIVDFQTGFLGDRMDLRRLLPTGADSNPAQHLQFTDDGVNVTVSVDVDGAGGTAAFIPLVVLRGVAPFSLQDALDDNQLLLP